VLVAALGLVRRAGMEAVLAAMVAPAHRSVVAVAEGQLDRPAPAAPAVTGPQLRREAWAGPPERAAAGPIRTQVPVRQWALVAMLVAAAPVALAVSTAVAPVGQGATRDRVSPETMGRAASSSFRGGRRERRGDGDLTHVNRQADARVLSEKGRALRLMPSNTPCGDCGHGLGRHNGSDVNVRCMLAFCTCRGFVQGNWPEDLKPSYLE